MNRNIAVFLSARQLPDFERELIKKAAQIVAECDWTLYYGGGYCGMMGLLSRTFEGLSDDIVGISTLWLRDSEAVDYNPEKTIFTQSMGSRKELQLANCSKVLILPGGFGTMDELFEALTLNQLGIINSEIYFYDPELAPVIKGMLKVMIGRGSISTSDASRIHFISSDSQLRGVLYD